MLSLGSREKDGPLGVKWLQSGRRGCKREVEIEEEKSITLRGENVSLIDCGQSSKRLQVGARIIFAQPLLMTPWACLTSECFKKHIWGRQVATSYGSDSFDDLSISPNTCL